MQFYIDNIFTAYSVRPALVLNEYNFTIRNLPTNPSLALPGWTVEHIIAEREQHLEIHRGELPEQIFDQHQLCLWIHEIQNENYSFIDIARFLTGFSCTERSPDGPDEYDFIAYQVCRKFRHTLESA